LRDAHVSFITEGHKHAQDGWVNFPCPFCTGNPGHHLGYSIDGNFFSCWRCGGHSVLSVIRELSACSWGKANQLLLQYEGASVVHQERVRLADKTIFPKGTGDMTDRHKKYLRGRNFDPDELERIWELQGTGMTGGYANRIIAPIHRKGRMVSYQGRDITDRHELKYKACPKVGEVVEHKSLLYGMDQVRGSNIVIVEGITDVWRLGPGAVATFGIKFRPPQVALMRTFKNRFILFDSEDQAQEQADKLFYLLSGFPGHTELLETIDSDPGAFSQEEADELMCDVVGE
jgi:hypothetical protein